MMCYMTIPPSFKVYLVFDMMYSYWFILRRKGKEHFNIVEAPNM